MFANLGLVFLPERQETQPALLSGHIYVRAKPGRYRLSLPFLDAEDQPGAGGSLPRRAVMAAPVEVEICTRSPDFPAFRLGMTEAEFKTITHEDKLGLADNTLPSKMDIGWQGRERNFMTSQGMMAKPCAKASLLFSNGVCIAVEPKPRQRWFTNEVAGAAADNVLQKCFDQAALVAVGEIASSTGPNSDGHGEAWHNFEFRIAEVLKGNSPAGVTIEAGVLRDEQWLPFFPQRPTFKQGDKLMLFLHEVGPKPTWTTVDRVYGAMRASPELVAQVKRLSAALQLRANSDANRSDQLAREYIFVGHQRNFVCFHKPTMGSEGNQHLPHQQQQFASAGAQWGPAGERCFSVIVRSRAGLGFLLKSKFFQI